MRPGEELLDGPPIHGNTRLEIIWTAIPAILLVGLVHLRLRRPARHRGGRRPSAMERPRRRRAVRLDLLLPRPGGKEIAVARSSTCPSTSRCKFTVQSKDVLHDFWVPAFRMKIDAVPGITTHLPRHAEPRSAPTRSSAPSCAGSATRHAPDRARRRAGRQFDSLARASCAAAPRPAAAAGGGGGGGAAAGRQGAVHHGTPSRRLRRLPHAGRRRRRPARPARTSTRSSRARTRPSSSSRSCRPERRDRQGLLATGSCPRTSSRR